MVKIYRSKASDLDVWAVPKGDGSYFVYLGEGRAVEHQCDSSYAIQHPDGLPNLVAFRRADVWKECELGIGECYPRIWRGPCSPGRSEYLREWAASYGAVSSLVRRMNEVFHFIEPNERNGDAYGHETRQLLMVAATEVESSFRAVLAANGYPKSATSSDRLTTTDFVALCEPMRLREWRVELSTHPDMPELAPFATWDEKHSTQSLSWYRAYNDVKHDRESNFSRATLREAVSAVAAAYIMVLAQFGEFDNRQFLGLDEFHQRSTPAFTPEEDCVPPDLAGGNRVWTRLRYFEREKKR